MQSLIKASLLLPEGEAFIRRGQLGTEAHTKKCGRTQFIPTNREISFILAQIN